MKWISVKDRLPEEYEYVILKANPLLDDLIDGPLIFVGHKRGNTCDSAWGDGWTPFQWSDITHWMPLPASPDEMEEEMRKFEMGFAYRPKGEK